MAVRYHLPSLGLVLRNAGSSVVEFSGLRPTASLSGLGRYLPTHVGYGQIAPRAKKCLFDCLTRYREPDAGPQIWKRGTVDGDGTIHINRSHLPRPLPSRTPWILCIFLAFMIRFLSGARC